MHSELFEFYTPTKDRLSKPMPEWIFHMERGSEGEPRRIKERGRGERGEKEAERGRETPGETGRRRRERGRGSEAMLACRRNISCTV